MQQFNRYLINLFSIFNLFILNFLIIFLKIKKKRIIFFYHPKKDLSHIHACYIENYLKKFKDFTVIFGSISFVKSRYFVVKPIYFKFILGVDIFASNNVCDLFINSSIKVYIHHDIYDTPLLAKRKESKLAFRLSCYDYLLIPSVKSFNLFNELFLKYKKKPKIRIIGEYPRLTYLKKRIINNLRKDSRKKLLRVIITPSGFYGVPKLSMKYFLKYIIKLLLINNIKVIFRPHPSDRFNKQTLLIKEKFKDNKYFILDDSDNYLENYKSSSLLITDYSGTAYTYSMITLNPVIFYSFNETYVNNVKYNKLNYFKDRSKIGVILKNPNKIIAAIEKSMKKRNKIYKNALKIRNKYFFNKKIINNAFILNKELLNNER
jgi:hypothetical protein